MPFKQETKEFAFCYVDNFNVPKVVEVPVNSRENDLVGEIIEAVTIFMTDYPKVSGFYLKISERKSL